MFSNALCMQCSTKAGFGKTAFTEQRKAYLLSRREHRIPTHLGHSTAQPIWHTAYHTEVPEAQVLAHSLLVGVCFSINLASAFRVGCGKTRLPWAAEWPGQRHSMYGRSRLRAHHFQGGLTPY